MTYHCSQVPHRPAAPPPSPQPISSCPAGAFVTRTSGHSSRGAAPFEEATGKGSPGFASIAYGAAELREVRRGPKADQVCPQTILQMEKPEVQRRETPQPRAEARARVSPRRWECRCALLVGKVLAELGPKQGTDGAVRGREPAWGAGSIAASVSLALDGRR